MASMSTLQNIHSMCPWVLVGNFDVKSTSHVRKPRIDTFESFVTTDESSHAFGLSKDTDTRVADVIAKQQVQVRVNSHHVKHANTQSPIHHPVIPVA